ncbi:MAG: NAD(P)H-dependent oxidoreductase [Devosia sp.]|uniref:NADPH-dependent FMN reductase n=1 Tax=Devosia sp. TaxID=1871048 RepID=UPI0024C651CA|nr:NADPH-dependent FMN reductase [Devosia sp.]UYN99795.1 MAG: NAD(P)H-dependent oxidoreductase [Devosia sp.]
MTTSLSLLTICGSLRQGSFNRMVANTLPELAPAGVTITMAPPIGDMPLYNADIQNGTGFPEAVTALGDAVRAADGVIFVSPEYNFSVPGVLKNALDWVSRLPDQPFQYKPVALQSAATGMLGGARSQYHMRQIMVFLDALVFTKPEVFVSFAKDKVDAGRGVLSDEPTRAMISTQLEGFARFVRKVGGPVNKGEQA